MRSQGQQGVSLKSQKIHMKPIPANKFNYPISSIKLQLHHHIFNLVILNLSQVHSSMPRNKPVNKHRPGRRPGIFKISDAVEKLLSRPLQLRKLRLVVIIWGP